MRLSIAMTNAMSGLHASTTRTAAIANNIANIATPGYSRHVTDLSTAPGGGVTAAVEEEDVAAIDLGTEMLDLLKAELAFKANASVFETGADMWDVLMTMVKD